MKYAVVVVLGVVSVLGSRSALAGPSDNVVHWHVDVKMSESETVTDVPPNDPANSHFDRQKTASASFSADMSAGREMGTFGTRLDVANGNVVSVSGNHSSVETSSTHGKYGQGNSKTTETAGASNKPGSVAFTFSYNSDSDWALDASVTMEGRSEGDSCSEQTMPTKEKHCDHAVNDISPGLSVGVAPGPNGRVTKTSNGYVVDYSFDETKAESPGRKEVHHLELHATLTRGDQKYEAVLRPAKWDEFHKWMPEGPKANGKNDDGNQIGVYLEIRDRASHKPDPTVKFAATYVIDASHIPGWAMNLRAPKANENDPDMFFKADGNKGHDVANKGLELRTKAGLGSETIYVSSRDWGGRAMLTAHVTVDGNSFDAKLVDEAGKVAANDSVLALPEDANKNHVADAFEKTYKLDSKVAASVDDEDLPAGTATKGDGYTLFEEYRGFWAIDLNDDKRETKHVQLDPTKKQLFVVTYGGDDATVMKGAKLYAGASHQDVYVVPSKDFVAAWVDDKPFGDVTGKDYPRQTDFEIDGNEKADFGDPMVAVRVFTAKIDDLGNTPPMEGEGYAATPKGQIPDHESPKTTVGCFLARTAAARQVHDWLWDLEHRTSTQLENGFAGANAPDRLAIVHSLANKKLYAQRVEALFAFAVMHELGHATGSVEHHVRELLDDPTDPEADPNDPTKKATKEQQKATMNSLYAKYTWKDDPQCPQRYWQFDPSGVEILAFLAGTWDPSKNNPRGGAWEYCKLNFGMLRLRQRAGQQWNDRPTPRD